MGATKWILGGLGFVMGGPIGAIIGVAIGSLFEASGAASNMQQPIDEGSQQRTHTSNQARYSRASANDVRVSLLVLIACVMKADGHIRKAELDAVKTFLRRNYSTQESLDALQILKKMLEQDIDPVAVSRQIASYVNYSTRLELLHFLLDLANADNEFAASEEKVIQVISNNMGISAADYQSLLSLYRKAQDPNWAYQALEIESSATDEEVKKAYRRVAMKYHPDKVAGAGEEMKAKATEKFQAINEAYEFIKKQRGIN